MILKETEPSLLHLQARLEAEAGRHATDGDRGRVIAFCCCGSPTAGAPDGGSPGDQQKGQAMLQHGGRGDRAETCNQFHTLE